MDKTIVEDITNHRTSRTTRADIGINGDDDDKLREVAIGHFGNYNRSLMMRMCVTLFLKMYENIYQFDEPYRDTVMMMPEPTINTLIEEPVLYGKGEPTKKQLTNLDNQIDPFKMIKGVKGIARYIGMSKWWTHMHIKELYEHGAVHKISRGKQGGVMWAGYPYYLMTYFSAKHKSKSNPHGFAVTPGNSPGRPRKTPLPEPVLCGIGEQTIVQV